MAKPSGKEPLVVPFEDLPHPVVVSTVCSSCGLNWDRHWDTPEAHQHGLIVPAICVRLLKEDLAKRPRGAITTYNGLQNVCGPQSSLTEGTAS